MQYFEIAMKYGFEAGVIVILFKMVHSLQNTICTTIRDNTKVMSELKTLIEAKLK